MSVNTTVVHHSLMTREYPQFKLRMPEELHAAIAAEAEAAGRSMNAEIVKRLENSTETWPKLRSDIWQEVADAAEENGINFAQQVERDLSFAHAPLLVRVSALLKEPRIRDDIANTAEARGASFQDEVVDRISKPRITTDQPGSSAANNAHLQQILDHIEQLKSASDEARAKGFVLGAVMTAIAATDSYMDRDKLIELVEALRKLEPADLKDSMKAESLVLGLRSGKRKPKS